jgi:uncharacterized protein YjbI with pentapeptide repeats
MRIKKEAYTQMNDDQEQEQLVPTYLSRVELEKQLSDAIYLMMPPIFQQLALHPRSINGIKGWGDYSGIDLEDIIAHKAILDSIRMERASLKRVDLTGANATASNFRCTDFSEAILNGVNFACSVIEHAIFKDAKMQGVCLVSAEATRACFNGADLTGAEFSGAMLLGASFAGANLTNTDFSGATLVLCNLSSANLTGANFDHARVAPVYLWETEYTRVQFEKAQPLDLIDGDKYKEWYEEEEDGYL